MTGADESLAPPLEGGRFGLASMSRSMAAMTWGFVALSVFLAVVALVVPDPGARWALAFAILVSVGVLPLVWFVFRPRWFDVSAEGLTIVWYVGARRVLATSIASVRAIGRDELGTMLRLWGVGGVFGGFGRFWSRKIGRLSVYATRRDGLVLIERHDGRPILITPADPDGFVDAVVQVLSADRPAAIRSSSSSRAATP